MVSREVIRLAAFVIVLTAIVLWEIAAPRRTRSHSRLSRWPGNLGIVALNTALGEILVLATPAGLALCGAWRGWGLFNNLPVPAWSAIVASIVLLDFAIYLQHVAFHAVPMLWRVHRVHHADLDLDATTGVRFHPIEIILSIGIKSGVVVVLGASALSVLIFEILLNATSMFNHGNVRIPIRADRYLRWVLVTPDMHSVHHSILVTETNSNFGFNLPWWDHLFGTYRDRPEAGHESMIIGLEHFRNARELRLRRLLLQPWRGGSGPYAMIQRWAA
jgi:sterol desaturase/sphingolipid hydroxylase (fatty acid hydroxylase superfamily)